MPTIIKWPATRQYLRPDGWGWTQRPALARSFEDVAAAQSYLDVRSPSWRRENKEAAQRQETAWGFVDQATEMLLLPEAR